ncbi:TetR/AcrR family transcriptional regulator [Frankia sp. AgB1.9]|uniref:TetR/AcrR family transcriptional regulator n=1 Tax=unclassified Frankia TaxID=2632575 RepID=UPI001932BACB|nr:MULTISPECIES: helix-turn-helix domain-containing protein [unclassified Frankia]MBL7489951.1 TetR/AcrR family transcriptional regulator [Frankia sp. AgW1.1]MBL7552161.1 TetR/AcrR family transcriptional regulator [Frankia sp. AgB1.9]MBL7625242.1 TetR/AcrR family transcriptional regulator [Frankia sp. AgB1.8]
MRDPLTPDRVINAARSLLERDGVREFSMRRLAADLGVAPTAIYWHVGNRDQLIDAVVDQTRDVLGQVSTVGESPMDRVLSTASSLLANINQHLWLVELAHQRGILLALLGPARRSIAAEFAAAGLRGPGIADATNAVVQLVGDHVTVGYFARTWRAQAVGDDLQEGAGPALEESAATALSRIPDRDRTFAVMLRALVAGLLADSAEPDGTGGHPVARISAGAGPMRDAVDVSRSRSKP